VTVQSYGKGFTVLKVAALLILSLCVFCVDPYARAETFTFDGSGTGNIDVFETAGTAASFYGARNRAPVTINDDGANFFFHRDTTTGIFSLGLIVNRAGDGSGGRFRGTISGLGSSAFVAVADDNAREFSITAPGTARFNFRFFGCCTDGGVISGLDPNNLALSIDVTRSQGLTDTFLVGPSGITSLGITPSAGLNFAVGPNPEPEMWSYFILGFGGIAVAMKRRRKLDQCKVRASGQFKKVSPYFPDGQPGHSLQPILIQD